MSKESCWECANLRTPICNGCKTIEKPNGTVIMTGFCKDDKPSSDDLGATIASRVKNHRILPIRIVLKYNEVITKEREKNGTQESGSALQDTE